MVIWSCWPSDDLPWVSTASDTLVDLHVPIRLPVLPWVAEIHAVVRAQDASICIESGDEFLFNEAAPETRDILLAVTAAEVGSTRTDHRLRGRRRGGAGTAEIYGLSVYLLRVASLPTGV